MLIHRLRNALMIFSSLLIYSNAMKWWVWSVCLDSGAVVIVWTALKMSQEVFFLHNLGFYYYLYLLPKSPTILFLQAFILPSELLKAANLCKVFKKMKRFERVCLNKKSTNTMSGEGDNWQCLVWLLALFTSCVVNFLMQKSHPYHLWPNLCHILMDLATMLYTRMHTREVQGPWDIVPPNFRPRGLYRYLLICILDLRATPNLISSNGWLIEPINYSTPSSALESPIDASGWCFLRFW